MPIAGGMRRAKKRHSPKGRTEKTARSYRYGARRNTQDLLSLLSQLSGWPLGTPAGMTGSAAGVTTGAATVLVFVNTPSV